MELNELFAGRQVVLARELTKKFEEYLRGTPAALLESLKQRSLKGEFVVLVAGGADPNIELRTAAAQASTPLAVISRPYR